MVGAASLLLFFAAKYSEGRNLAIAELPPVTWQEILVWTLSASLLWAGCQAFFQGIAFINYWLHPELAPLQAGKLGDRNEAIEEGQGDNAGAVHQEEEKGTGVNGTVEF